MMPSPVEILLNELHNDHELQRIVSSSNRDEITELLRQRDVDIDPELLDQFINQASTEETADEELTLQQLEDVAGGLGVTDVMVSSVVLAVVASNAGSLMGEAKASSGFNGNIPLASLRADSTIAGQVSTLESLGIQLVVGDPSIQGASAEWNPQSGTITISDEIMQRGRKAVLQAMNHEAVHVAQSCNAGGINMSGSSIGIDISGEAVQALNHEVYENASPQTRQLELEAYTLTKKEGAGIVAAIDNCSE